MLTVAFCRAKTADSGRWPPSLSTVAMEMRRYLQWMRFGEPSDSVLSVGRSWVAVRVPKRASRAPRGPRKCKVTNLIILVIWLSRPDGPIRYVQGGRTQESASL